MASVPHFTPWRQSYPTGQSKVFYSLRSIPLIRAGFKITKRYYHFIFRAIIVFFYLYCCEGDSYRLCLYLWVMASHFLSINIQLCSTARLCLCVKNPNFMAYIIVIRSHIEVEQNQENLRLQSGCLSSKRPVQHNRHRWIIKFKCCERQNSGMFEFWYLWESLIGSLWQRWVHIFNL